MEDLEKDQDNLSPQDDNNPESSFNNTNQVTGNIQNIGKKGINTLRGLGAATEEAEATAGAQAAEQAAGVAAGSTAQGAATAGVAAATEEAAAAGEVAASGIAASAATGESVATAGAVATAGGSAIGMWALVACLICVFVFTIIVVIIGGEQAVNGGNFVSQNPPPATTPGDSIEPGPKPTVDEFLSYFNVYQCVGPANVGLPLLCSLQKKGSNLVNIAYKRLSDPLRSQGYINALGLKQKKINIKFGSITISGCGFSGGGAWNGNDLRLDGYTTPGCDENNRKWSMIHETGHIMQSRNPSLYSSFPLAKLAQEDGATCYDQGVDGPYIKTYRYRNGAPSSGCTSTACGGGFKAESFGEAVGMNVTCGPSDTCDKTGLPGHSLTNYPQKCASTYAWIRKNVYGDVDFFGLGGATNPSLNGFIFYCQYGGINTDGVLISSKRGQWNYKKPSGGTCDIEGSGCAMTSLAMIMTYFGDPTTPSQASQQNNYVGCQYPGTTTDDINNTVAPRLKKKGYQVVGNFTRFSFPGGTQTGNVNLSVLQKYLDHGFILLAGGKIKYGTSTGLSNGYIGHAFVITDVDPANDTVTGYDPTFCEGGLKNGKRVFRNVNSLGGDFGCVRADGIQKCGWSMVYAIKK